MESENTCEKHKKKIEAYCFSNSCLNRQCCINCIISDHSHCGYKFISVEDIISKKPTAILQKEPFSLVFGSALAQSIDKTIETDYESSIHSIITEFLDKINVKMTQIEQKLIEESKTLKVSTGFKARLSEIFEMDKIAEVAKQFKGKELEDKLNGFALFSEQRTLEERLVFLKNSNNEIERSTAFIDELKEEIARADDIINENIGDLQRNRILFKQNASNLVPSFKPNQLFPNFAYQPNLNAQYYQENSYSEQSDDYYPEY